MRVPRREPEVRFARDQPGHRALVSAGVERVLASRLVEFVLMAYCRALLEQTGARFPETFQRYRKDGTISPELSLTSEPVLGGRDGLCPAEVERDISLDEKLRVAGRSAVSFR